MIPKNSKVTEREAQEFIKNKGKCLLLDENANVWQFNKFFSFFLYNLPLKGEDGSIIKGDHGLETHQPGAGRLIFRKPNKSTENERSTAKRINEDNSSSSTSRSKISKIDNHRLLSFGNDEDED